MYTSMWVLPALGLPHGASRVPAGEVLCANAIGAMRRESKALS